MTMDANTQKFVDETLAAYRTGMLAKEAASTAVMVLGAEALEEAGWSLGPHTHELARVFAEALIPYLGPESTPSPEGKGESA